MAAPIYFFAGLASDQLVHQDKLIRQTLERYGLLDQFGDVRSVQHELAIWDHHGAGPDGKSGTLLRAYTRQLDGSMKCGQRQGYYPQQQNWTKVFEANETELWIGLDKDEPVGPEDLRRNRIVRGHEIELGDGREWTIPVIRRPPGENWRSTNLPSAMTWDEHGKYTERVKAQYVAIWEATADVLAWFDGKQFLREEMPRALALAVQALGLNYRFGRYEQRLLELVDSENYLLLLSCTIDWPLVQLIAREKKDPAADSEQLPEQPEITSPGQPDETRDTAPAVAS